MYFNSWKYLDSLGKWRSGLLTVTALATKALRDSAPPTYSEGQSITFIS